MSLTSLIPNLLSDPDAQAGQPTIPKLGALPALNTQAPALTQMIPPTPLASLPDLLAPNPDVFGMGSSIPTFPNTPPVLRPLITSPRQQQEDQLQQQINGYEHPDPQQPGFWHKLGHIAARVGNIAGDVFAPATMALIPGTDLNRSITNSARMNELAGLQKQDLSEQDDASRRALEGAQAADAEANAEAVPGEQASKQMLTDAQITSLLHPQAKSEFELWRQQNPNGSVEDWLRQQADAKEQSPTAALQRQLIDAENRGDTDAVAKLKQQLKDLNPMAEQRLNVEVGNQTAKQDASTRQAAYKAFQPSLDSAERFDVMSQNYIDALKNHDQQAMLSLLANHLGMTMGLQKGARMTKDIIREAQESRPWLQGLQAKFDSNGYLSGVTLTPNQMRQMLDLGRDRYVEDTQKARSEASYLGAGDDGPDRIPSKATINFYLSQTNGDVARAKSLAQQDGWTIK